MQREITLTQEQCDKLNHWIKSQVEHHIPLQYLLGSVPFIDCDILVEPPVLIPRPETEEWCLDLIKSLEQLPHQDFRILDLCTGSGCIAIALAKAFPHAHMYASDISDTALALAQKNAERNKVSINLISSDLFTSMPRDLTFDIIVANPPYIAEHEWHKLDPSVKTWEDTTALIASDDGLGMIKQVITDSVAFLDHHSEITSYGIPSLMIEIGHTQGESVQRAFEKADYKNVEIKKDQYGKDRIAVGYINNVEQTKAT
jgi:release factor glutamine methyltransferase